MIVLRRLNNEEFTLNSDLIELIDEKPDTIITLLNGHKYVVLESTEEVIKRIKEYKHEVFLGATFTKEYFVEEG